MHPPQQGPLWRRVCQVGQILSFGGRVALVKTIPLRLGKLRVVTSCSCSGLKGTGLAFAALGAQGGIPTPLAWRGVRNAKAPIEDFDFEPAFTVLRQTRCNAWKNLWLLSMHTRTHAYTPSILQLQHCPAPCTCYLLQEVSLCAIKDQRLLLLIGTLRLF